MMNNREFAAYLAGFTDGEGYIGFAKDCRGSGKTVAVNIAIANTFESVLLMIQRRLGYGTIHSQQQRPQWKRKYVFNIRNMSDCLQFLKLVNPFLHVKAEVSQRAIEHIESRIKFWASKRDRDKSVRARAAKGEMRKTIAADLGISQQLVSHICEGHKWPSQRKGIMKHRKRDHRGLFVKA